MQVILAQPRGFCAGVERAIEIVERALALYGPPVYVRHEIVHNGHVVERLRAKGVRFVDEVDEVPPGGVTIFSAHGVSTAVDEAARARGLHVIDATCPLVARVHLEGARYSRQGRDVVLIGHAGHAEVEGTLGRLKGPVHLVGSVEEVAGLEVSDPGRVAYITQTTLSIDDTRGIIEALKARYPPSSAPTPTTSATRPRTASAPCWALSRWSTWCWWSGRRTAPTPTGCARSRGMPAFPPI
ncbi:4-hydroxy-3-methylbut-2-enyl diphosphate reductase [Skermanella pratensis]|uniref:4-hydroxy-3-methylbut-2-enyl diphosphate reductase n=1 Tax=Skermanella pratensis TaxID=2233999 RepID=UPI003CCD82FD